MVNYINGAILEGIEKARTLKGKIPRARDLGLYFSPLATIANNEIDNLINDFTSIYYDVDYSNIENLRQKFIVFKQLSGKLSEIENVVIAAISRKTNDDEFVNKLVFGICEEINYPLQSPVASCLSQKYYHIYPYYNLICIPLLESDFLLHIPDVYHELGHPLVSIDNPKRLQQYQVHLGKFIVIVKKYFNDEIRRRTLNKFIKDDGFNSLDIWRDSWVENWATELFCDLFATYTLGPAYAWSNIHMCTKMSWDIYRLSIYQKSSHPPDDARMNAILLALKKINFSQAAKDIEVKWEEFKQIVNKSQSADYAIAVPDILLETVVDFCYFATKEIGCTIVEPETTNKFFSTLNNAWNKFWESPSNFNVWEKEQVKLLKESTL